MTDRVQSLMAERDRGSSAASPPSVLTTPEENGPLSRPGQTWRNEQVLAELRTLFGTPWIFATTPPPRKTWAVGPGWPEVAHVTLLWVPRFESPASHRVEGRTTVSCRGINTDDALLAQALVDVYREAVACAIRAQALANQISLTAEQFTAYCQAETPALTDAEHLDASPKETLTAAPAQFVLEVFSPEFWNADACHEPGTVTRARWFELQAFVRHRLEAGLLALDVTREAPHLFVSYLDRPECEPLLWAAWREGTRIAAVPRRAWTGQRPGPGASPGQED